MIPRHAARRLPTQRDILEEPDGLFRLDGDPAGETLLIRHAQPAGSNPEHEAESAPDPMLSCEGLRQAELLADRLSNLEVEAIYAAPERRCFQTAKIVADVLQRPLVVTGELTDIAFDPEMFEAAGDAYAERFGRDPRWDALPGFASGSAFRRQAVAAIERIIAAHPAGRSAVISHASVLNVYLGLLLRTPRDLFFAPDHASVSIVRHREGQAVLRSLNDTSHLAPSATAEARLPAFTGRSLPLTNR